MPSWLKHVFFVLLLVVFGGCAGSCSGCSGCGMTPLPGGFQPEKRIENAASARLTKSGLEFIGQNIAGLAPSLLGGAGQVDAGVVTFNVPTSTSDITVVIKVGTITTCPDGPKETSTPPECVVEADLGKANLTISTAAPTNIKVTGTLAVRLQKLPVKGTGVGAIANSSVVLDNGGNCNNTTDYANIPVDVDISLEVDKDATHGSRKGYTKVKINKIDINQGAIENSIVFCGGFNATIVNLLKPLLVGQLLGGLTGTLTDTVEQQLCTKEDPTTGVTCPSGTFPDTGGTCRYCTPDGNGNCPSSAECVGTALGIDGNINLSDALSSLSPGTKGGFDFLMAVGGEGARDDGSGMAWGDLNPIGGGATLGLMGGAEPMPITQCVPIANLVKPDNIPIPDELQDSTKLLDNGIPNWTGAGPHFGLAVSERYLNYTLGAVYNSGALCLGVGSSTLGSLLNSDTISLLIPSFKDLARQKQTAPLALVVRPQEPPNAVVGTGVDITTDPLLKVTMNKLKIDFYVWSSDRFIRAFTAQFDIVAPVNLDVTDAGLAPVLDSVAVTNPSIENALLREDEATAAKALADIISSQIGSALGGAISPIDLSSQLSSFGLKLNIPPTVQGQGSPGLTKLEKGTDRYLAIFAGFEVATPTAAAPPLASDTSAQVTEKRVQRAGLELPTITEKNVPEVDLALGSSLDDGAHELEWQVRIDGGMWHSWASNRYVTLRSPTLSLQMRHQVEVRSRVVGQPETMDATPAKLEVLIDKTEPSVHFAKRVEDGKIGVEIKDVVSPSQSVLTRWSLDDGPMTEWTAAAAFDSIEVGDATRITLEAKDEEGNVAQKSQALIRGKKDASLGGGSSACGCKLAGGPEGRSQWPALPVLLGLGLLFWRRKGQARRTAPRTPKDERRVRHVRMLGSVALMGIAASWSGCSCGSDDSSTNNKPKGCPGLETCQTLEPGLVGAYASAVVDSKGTVWVAGYDDLGYGTTGTDEEQFTWGDLVVGKWDGTKVDWESVDGLPDVDPELDPGTTGGPADPQFNDVKGFRQGLTDPGDDVGLWTSIALVDDKPVVAYYDAKNRGLKFASYDGKSWSVSNVQSKANSDIGRYAKLVVSGGKPVIAFLFQEPGTGGAAKSGVRVATANSASPAGPSDWTFADAYTDNATPCRAFLCTSGECRDDTLLCQAASTGCATKCATDEKCFDDNGNKVCAKVFAKNYPDAYPEAAGLYVSLAETKSGLGMVFYDRIHGNLMATHQEGGKWTPAVLLDGQGKDSTGADIDTGDVGVGASLFVDTAGDWHVAYANGFDETLVYMKVTGGTTPGTPEVVDDGVVPGEQAVVGDDTSIRVTSTGEVQIAYQDATRGKAKWASGTPTGGTHTWTKKELNVSDFAGAFSKVLDVGGQTRVLTWWRRAKPRTEGDISIVSP